MFRYCGLSLPPLCSFGGIHTTQLNGPWICLPHPGGKSKPAYPVAPVSWGNGSENSRSLFHICFLIFPTSWVLCIAYLCCLSGFHLVQYLHFHFLHHNTPLYLSWRWWHGALAHSCCYGLHFSCCYVWHEHHSWVHEHHFRLFCQSLASQMSLPSLCSLSDVSLPSSCQKSYSHILARDPWFLVLVLLVPGLTSSVSPPMGLGLGSLSWCLM